MKHWANMEERGIVWGMQALVKVYLLFGRRVLQFFLYPVVIYYWLRNSSARHASLQYLHKVAQISPGFKEGHYYSYLHFINFANSIIDKLASWSGALTLKDVDYSGREGVIQTLDQGKGVLMFGSHLGNLEVCRVIGYLRNKVTINVLVHTKHAEKFNTLLNRYAEAGNVNLIQVSEINAATAMLLQDKIDAGEIVVIAADRVPLKDHGRVITANFLGSPALFPQGPVILASLLKCPVFTLFCIKQGERHHIYFDLFCERVTLSRQQRESDIQKYMQQFAVKLEEYCLKTPMQWFNFYDFWPNGNG